MANFTSHYTGAQIEEAVRRALNLDNFAYCAQEVLNSKVYWVQWKVQPTNENTVYGITFDPVTGEEMIVQSVNGTKTIKAASEISTITNTEINNLFS